MHTPSARHGFTLLELSIVLIIIALLVGGIMTGRAVIYNARLQAVMSDVDRFTKAIGLFKSKYKDLPGDLTTATTFWGADAGCPNTPANANKKTATCNGDGDGYITSSNSSASTIYTGDNSYFESLRAWQHLSNAGFIDEQVNGARSSRTPGKLDPGMNIPVSSIKGSGFSLQYAYQDTTAGANNEYFKVLYNHVLIYGRPNDTAPTMNAPALSAVDAQQIDLKLDDGIPSTGKVLTYGIALNPECTQASGTSYTSNQGNICTVIFITGY